MVDSSLSSDLEQEGSPPKVQQQRRSLAKKPRAKATSKSSRAHHSSSKTLAQNKTEQRKHKALERQFEKAKSHLTCHQASATDLGLSSRSVEVAGPSHNSQATSASSAGSLDAPPNLGLSKGVSLSLPDVSSASAVRPSSDLRRLPEATFTPTAAGFCPEEAGAQFNFQSILSDALAKLLAAGLQQGAGTSQPQSLPSQALVPDTSKGTATVSSHADYKSSDDSEHGGGH